MGFMQRFYDRRWCIVDIVQYARFDWPGTLGRFKCRVWKLLIGQAGGAIRPEHIEFGFAWLGVMLVIAFILAHEDPSSTHSLATL